MTFDASVPNSGQSPGLLPIQGSTNFTRLKQLINAEHVFNDSTGVTDGVHKQMTMINRTNPVTLPAGTNGMIYMIGNRPKVFNGTTSYFLAPILASVMFNNTGAIQGVATNVTSVVRNSVGNYTINFTNSLAGGGGPFNVNAYSGSSTQLLVAGLTEYQDTYVRILVKNAATGTTVDAQLSSVIIYYGN